MYDAEREQMDIFRGAAVLAPEFKELEKEKEMRRYNRQEVTIKAMVKKNPLLRDSAQAKFEIFYGLLLGAICIVCL